MIVDAHLHCSGQESTHDVLTALDDARVDVGVLLAPFLTPPYSYGDRESLRAANRHLADIVAGHGDRLIGLAVVNPALPDAAADLRHAIEDLHLSGAKMVPSGWYPYDECALKVYSELQSLRVPVLFHSGIFIDGRSGRFCRPVFFEALREFPEVRVTLAHLGWPWCDEANAVGVIDLINGVEPDNSQFRFDISFGAPPVYRHDVLHKAVAVLGPSLLQFGSDRFFPCSGEHIATAISEARELLRAVNLSNHEIDRVMGGTASAWLRLRNGQ